MIRAIVCGGRNFRERDLVFSTLDRLHAARRFSLIIEGGQRTRDPETRELVGGADFFAFEWATHRGIPVATEAADWRDLSHPDARIVKGASGKLIDRQAGPRRNQLMIDKHAPNCLVALPGGRGTKSMIALARAAGLEIIEVKR